VESFSFSLCSLDAEVRLGLSSLGSVIVIVIPVLCVTVFWLLAWQGGVCEVDRGVFF